MSKIKETVTVLCFNSQCDFHKETTSYHFSQARKWAREHNKLTNHTVYVTRSEVHEFTAESDDDS